MMDPKLLILLVIYLMNTPRLIGGFERRTTKGNVYNDQHILYRHSNYNGEPIHYSLQNNLHDLLEENPNSEQFLLPIGVTPNNGSTYDYIVVGAGAAGTAAASRLALSGDSVLLIEAGGNPNLISKIPGLAMSLLGSSIDWKYPTISNNISCLSSRNQQCRFSRGKCLGGSTSMNYMMYVRGNRRDFDDMGIQNWTWADMEPWFKIYEGLQDLDSLPASSIPYHNTTGIMKIEFFSDSMNSWHPRIFEGLNKLNVSFVADVNAESQIGVSQVIGYVYNGTRMSTARAYLTNSNVTRRLKIAKNTQCTGVIMDDDNVARGVTVVSGLLKRRLNLYARKEVILSAGTIGTPQLLMLSGIGPTDHLKEIGIPVRANLPVGENLKDHVLPLLFILVDRGFGVDVPNLILFGMKGVQAAQWLLTRTGPLASNGLTDVTAFLNTRCYDFNNRKLVNDQPECDLPNLQLINAYIDRNSIQGLEPIVQNAVNFDDEVFQQIKDANIQNAFIVASPLVLEPHSVGYVRLASADPLDLPAIYPNFLSDDRDMDQMLSSIEFVEHLIETEVFKKHNATLLRPVFSKCPVSYEANKTEYWMCYCRHMTYSVYHATGTAVMGGVVDTQLRVKGIPRLRVADLSVLLKPPHGNTAAVAIALGERVAHFISDNKEDTFNT